MTPQAHLLQSGLITFVSVLLAVVVMRILNGQIRLRGVVADELSGLVRADRMQMFVVSIGVAVAYMGAALEAGCFPAVPEWVLMVVGGSQGIYLTGKQLRSR